LENESEPIKHSIKTDLNHILEELDTEELKEEFEEKFKQRFRELEDKLINSQRFQLLRGFVKKVLIWLWVFI
jgi:hypothetical protein